MDNNSVLFNNTITNSISTDEERAGIAIFVIFFLACVLLASFVIVSNTLFILACCRTRSLRTIATKHVHSLAAADITLGVAMYAQGAFYVSSTKGNLHSIEFFCMITVCFLSVGLTCSFMSVMLIAIDRYIYIVHPYRYPQLITAERTSITIVISWAIAIVYATVPLYNRNESSDVKCSPTAFADQSYAISRLVVFLLATSVSGFCHLSIHVTAMRHIRKLYPAAKKQIVSLAYLDGEADMTPEDAKKMKSTNFTSHMSATLKLVKTFFLVHILFVCSWLPGLIAYSLGSSHRILLNILALMAELSTGLNVLVYVFSNRQFKYAIVRVLGCPRKPNGISPDFILTSNIP